MQDSQDNLADMQNELARAHARISELESQLAAVAGQDNVPEGPNTGGERLSQRIAQRLEGLHRLDRAILSAQSLEDLAELALDHVIQLVPCYRATLSTADPEAGTVYILAAYSQRPTAIAARRTYPLDRGLVAPLDTEPCTVIYDLDQSGNVNVEQLYREGIRSMLIVGLRAAGKLIGLLSFHSLEASYFTGEIIDIALEVADQVAISVSRTLLSDALARHTAELEQSENSLKRYVQRMKILHAIDLGLIAGGSIQELLDVALKQVRQIIPCQQARAALLDESTHEVVIFAGDSSSPSVIKTGQRYLLPSGFFEAFGNSTVRILDDVLLIPNLWETYKADGMRSVLHVLLVIQDRPVGVITLNADTPGFFTPEYQETAVEIANQLAIAVRQLRMAEELARHAALLEQHVAERTAELQASKDRLEAILNNSRDGILLIERDLNIQQANDAFNKLAGTASGEPPVTSLLEFVCDGDAPRVKENVEMAVAEHVSPQIEVRAGRKDGSTIDLELSVRHIPGNGLVCAIHDITERKQAEAELAQKYQDERQMQDYLKALHEITILLTRADTLDDFCRCTVEQALGRFDFERMGFFLYKDEVASGTYGTDAQGRVIDEHHLKLGYDSLSGILKRTLDRNAQFVFEEEDAIFDNLQPIGRGHHAAAALWNTEVMGWLVVDNGAHHRPITQAQLDILALYALTVGSLLARKRAESALRESETRYRFLAENVKDVISTLSLDGVRTFITPSIYDLLGYKPEELIGRPGFDVVHPEDRRENQEIIQQALSSDRAFVTLTQRFQHKQGHYLWVEVKISVVRDADSGQPVEMIGIVRDITERKQAEDALRASEEKFRLFIDSAPIAAFITDQNGTIVLANQEAEKLLGYDHDALLGQPIEILVPEAFRNAHVDLRSAYVSGEITRRAGMAEVSARRQDGSVFLADIQLSSVDTPNGQLVMSFMIDVTQRRQAEQALRQALAQEKELGELKTRFVSVASHEFRTPLATILATTETLAFYRDRMTPDQIDARLEKIGQQVMHMKEIMEDVLQLARLQAGRIEFQPSPGNLDALCQEIVEEYVSQAPHRGRIVYSCATPPVMAHFDARLMRQVIDNLVSNALKYSSAEKSIQIDLSHDDDQIVLRVNDDGIGIPAEDMKHLFEPFHRTSNVGTISGTGLGLSITKHAVELHGGTILPESQPGMGTTFTVTLPLRPGK